MFSFSKSTANFDIRRNSSWPLTYGYVYLLYSKVTGQQYVGATDRALCSRLKEHRRGARDQKQQSKLYRALREHGVQTFAAVIIDTASSPGQLATKEAAWIKRLDTFQNGLNSTRQGSFQPRNRELPRRNCLLVLSRLQQRILDAVTAHPGMHGDQCRVFLFGPDYTADMERRFFWERSDLITAGYLYENGKVDVYDGLWFAAPTAPPVHELPIAA